MMELTVLLGRVDRDVLLIVEALVGKVKSHLDSLLFLVLLLLIGCLVLVFMTGLRDLDICFFIMPCFLFLLLVIVQLVVIVVAGSCQSGSGLFSL